MGRSEVDGVSDYYPLGSPDEIPEHDAEVAGFSLDKYEVTVGRFRKFIEQYDQWRIAHPDRGEGAHPAVQSTGWAESWSDVSGELPRDASSFRSVIKSEQACNWTEYAGGAEIYPINCVSWYEAFAFCIWDGGRLPTEAEWEYAAAGGSENRLYPWGNDIPGQVLPANYGDANGAPTVSVGSQGTAGEGYFHHQDLAGSMFEWVFDWFSNSYGKEAFSCVHCVNVTKPLDTAGGRVNRGGSWRYGRPSLRAAARFGERPVTRQRDVGFRCARDL